MEGNNDSNNFKVVTSENTSNNNKKKSIFKSINFKKKDKKKFNPAFSKNVLVPFCSGVVGCSLVLGVCFGIPQVKENLLGNSNNTQSTSSSVSNSQGTVSQVSLQNYSDTAVYAANKILPSIVGIEIQYTVSGGISMFGQSSSQQATASGSGIIISADGYILTNNHVVDTSSSSSSSYYDISKASKVTVKLYNSDTLYTATIVGQDSQTDLAVLKIDASNLTPAEFADSDSVKVGEFAMAVGNPLDLDFSISTGVVSALNRKVTSSEGTTYTCIQTDAAINSGNSGGALVNSEGKVIGINTLKLSGSDIEGIGFAIPINSTLNVTSQLIQNKKVLRPYIGLSGIDLDQTTANSYHLVVGVYVKSIEDFSAAEKAGIKAGDVIIEFDGQKIETMEKLNEIKNSHNIGDTIKIKVNRDGQEKELEVTLAEAP